MVDVRDARWQNWLIARANSAYALGNRGIFWDQAGVENLCGGWGGDTTKQQAAIDALGSVTSTLRAQHPDLKFIVNQGYGLANKYTSLVVGLMEENLLNYCQQTNNNQWCTDEIAKAQAVRALGITIIGMEYIDLMNCSDTTCSYATQLVNQAAGYGWVPYVTKQIMNYQGRGLAITPPW